MPGPPPTKHPRRRNARPDCRNLPAEGRQGDPPRFPLPRPSAAVRALWADLWSCPQADAWEQLGWTRVVARYAKLLVRAEKASAPGVLLSEVRQLEDRLGLSPMAMKRLQWEIVAPEPAAHADVANLDDYRELYGS
jgi:hypothetical protein